MATVKSIVGFKSLLLLVLFILIYSPTIIISKYEFSSEFPTFTLDSTQELEPLSKFRDEFKKSQSKDKTAVGSPPGPENEFELYSILKDELQQLRMELTRSFVEKVTRRKRDSSQFHSSSSSFSIKVTIDKQLQGTEEQFSQRIENVGHSTTVFKSSTILFKRDGIYRLERSSPTSSAQLVKIASWQLQKEDVILNSFEWEDKLFILTANSHGFCQVYTMHMNSGSGAAESPVSTQRIRNRGRATSAQFFTHGNALYMVITVDNEAHSLTSSPVFRWVHTYMDQIHEIQTRGASACETFTIGQLKYLAVAQTQDADANSEVGTILVRMHANGEVEKFQLLWSKAPITLKYLPFLKEHFLIVGQPAESLVYWFGGFDFLQWQALDGLSGQNLHLDGFVWQGEPILLASSEKEVRFFTRTGSSSNLASSKLVQTSTAYVAKGSERILEAKLLQNSKMSAPSLALTIETSSSSSPKLEIMPLQVNSEEIPASQIRETEDKLSACMVSLDTLLIRDEPALTLFESGSDLILRRNEPQNFSGRITSQGTVLIESNEEKNSLRSVVVKPEFEMVEDACEHPPSKTLTLIEAEAERLSDNIEKRLSNVLLKSVESEITGDLTFKKQLKINTLISDANLNLRTLNGVEWSTLESKVLRRGTIRPQSVIGKWEIETLNASSVQSSRKTPQSFLLHTCSKGETQIIQGEVQFEKDVNTQNLQIAELATINGMKYSDIALRSVSNVIEGYKQADILHGDEGLEIDRLNNVKLSEWYASVLKIDGDDEQQVDGTLTFTEFSAKKLQAESVNERNWGNFIESVLLDAGDQTLRGDLSLKNLRINHLHTETINEKELSSLLSTSSDQLITSEFHVENLKIKKNLNPVEVVGDASSYKINGINIEDAVLSTEDATIQGPVELKNADIDELQTSPGVTINGLEVEGAVKLRKKHIYSTSNADDVIEVRGDVRAANLYANSMNEILFESIKDQYWSSSKSNEVLEDFDMSHASKVAIENEFTTLTLNELNLASDVVTINDDETIETPGLEFIKPVAVEGHVIMPDGITMNDIDFSELNNQIVRTSDIGRKITGKKTFEDDLDLENGMTAHKINEITLESDVVLLKPSTLTQSQQVFDSKTFDEILVKDVTKSGTDVRVEAVNGHDLVKLGENSIYRDGLTAVIHSDFIFEKSVTAHDLFVQDINGLKVNEVLSQTISLADTHNLDLSFILNGGSLSFATDANVVLVNNILLNEYLPKVVNKHEVVEIGGVKKFLSEFHVTGDLDSDLVNDVNLKDIAEFGFSKTKDQVISGKYTVEQAEIGTLITEKIGGLQVSDFVRTDKASEINVPVTFTKAVIAVDKFTIEGLLNNYKIDELAEDLKTLKGNREFHTVTVDGNLSWDVSHEEFERLSHIYNNAVTIDTPQTLMQQVTFEEGFQAIEIKSEKGVNGIDYAAIVEDAVDVNDQNLEMQGRITFLNSLEISHGELSVEKLQTEEVDGIELARLDELVVRKNTKEIILGTKVFERGLSVKHVRVSGKIDSVTPDEIGLTNSSFAGSLIMRETELIIGDLTFDSLPGIELESLLNDRVTNDGDHIMRGDITFEDDLQVNHCAVKSINGIELSDLLIASPEAEEVQKITGSKTFTDILIESQIENTPVNGYSFDQIGTQILRRDRNETIRRPVIFVGTIHVEDTINVDEHLNDHTFEKLTDNFAQTLTQISEIAKIEKPKINKAMALIKQLEKNLDKMPGWFDFLEFGQNLLTSSYRVEHTISKEVDGGHVLRLFLHEFTEGRTCGLPASCAARSVHTFSVGQQDVTTNKIVSKDCTGVFQVTSALSGTTYHIVNEAKSTNSTCINPAEAGVSTTTVHFLSQTTAAQEFTTRLDQAPQAKINTGFVEDVKTFSVNGKDYWVIAQSFDATTSSHATPTLVYEVFAPGDLNLVQQIESHGAKRLSIDFVDSKWILGIVNTEPDAAASPSCHIHSEIHFWDEMDKEFKLIRNVETEGPTDIASTTVVTGVGEFAENFITFSETRDTDVENEQIGKVSIYRYERERMSYTLYQTIDTAHPVKSLSTLNTREFTYVVTISEDGLKFYKYLHAEGFRQDLAVPFVGAMDANGIVWNNQIVFPIVGSKSILAKGKFSGKISKLF